MIHHLVFENRRPQLLLDRGVVLDEVKERPLLPRILPRGTQDRLRHLGIRHFDPGLAPHFGQHQPQPHPARRQRLVLVGHIHLVVIVVMHVRVFLVPQLMGNLSGLGIQQAGGQIERDQRIQLVQQCPLHH